MTDGTPGDHIIIKDPRDARFDLRPGAIFEPWPIAVTNDAWCFQSRVSRWMQATFGPKISADTTERNHRFLEEGLELVQACGCTASEAHQLVDYVFGRPVGDKPQEIGGVMVTLAALCEAQELSMDHCGDIELTRCWSNIKKIRAKQAAKPKHSPLPAKPIPGQRFSTALYNTRHLTHEEYSHISKQVDNLPYKDWAKTLFMYSIWQKHPVYQWAQRKIGAA